MLFYATVAERSNATDCKSVKPGVRIPPVAPSLGLKVFMDAHNTVTVEEGDRYPLRPPIFEATPPGYFLARALGPATVASPYFIP